MYQEMYHLYHHQPDPLDLEALHDRAWLLNNGVNYSVVATIRAPTPAKAYEGLLAKLEDHRLRSVEIKIGNIIRETLPGDVLVGEKKAWMILPDGQLHLLPHETRPSQKSYTHDSSVECLSWAPDGKYLAACSNHVLLHNLYGNDEPRYSATSYCRHGNHTVCAVAWSPDGTHIASGGYDAEIHVWKPSPAGGVRGAARGSIVICRTPEISKSYERKITCLSWAPDSRTLLAGSHRDIVQWDAVTGECLHIFHRHQGAVTALAYAPDGNRVASTSEDGVLSIWSIEDAHLEIICQHTGKVPSFAWSPDGSLLVSSCQGEQSLQFWDALSGIAGERIPLSIYSTKLLKIKAIAWSPDGRFLAAGCDDGTLQIIDVRLRRHIQTYRAAHSEIYCVAWSPDGHALASGEGGANGVQIWQMERPIHREEDADALHDASTKRLSCAEEKHTINACFSSMKE